MRCCGPLPRFSLVRRQDRWGCARRPCARPSSTRSPIRLGEVYSSALHMPSEGSSTHCLSQAEKSKLRKRNEPDKNPARTWRQGKAAEVFQKEQVRDLYPDGEPCRNVIPKKSKRMKVCEDKQQEGELYAGQVDTWSQMLRGVAPDCPGVLAGQSTWNRLPNLRGGFSDMGSNYAWAPLARTFRLGIG